jgi:hypothetical protein
LETLLSINIVKKTFSLANMIILFPKHHKCPKHVHNQKNNSNMISEMENPTFANFSNPRKNTYPTNLIKILHIPDTQRNGNE